MHFFISNSRMKKNIDRKYIDSTSVFKCLHLAEKEDLKFVLFTLPKKY